MENEAPQVNTYGIIEGGGAKSSEAEKHSSLPLQIGSSAKVDKISRLRYALASFGLMPVIVSIAVFFLYLFLIFQGIRFAGNLFLGTKTVSPAPTPIQSGPTLLPTQSPTLTPTKDDTSNQKTYCQLPRPEVCTMECLLPPPYLCGSNRKSYCTACQACSDSNVDWHQFQDEPCADISSGPKPLGDAATKEECLAKDGKWQQWGLLQQEYCQIPSKDAETPCTDGSECEYGLCMSQEQSSRGVCSTYPREFGCYSTIVNGQPGPAVCVD